MFKLFDLLNLAPPTSPQVAATLFLISDRLQAPVRVKDSTGRLVTVEPDEAPSGLAELAAHGTLPSGRREDVRAALLGQG